MAVCKRTLAFLLALLIIMSLGVSPAFAAEESGQEPEPAADLAEAEEAPPTVDAPDETDAPENTEAPEEAEEPTEAETEEPEASEPPAVGGWPVIPVPVVTA